jgi:RHS repeat-associated protein
MSDGSGQTAWSYDSMGRIAVEQRTIGFVTETISFGYSKDASLAWITYPSGSVLKYGYGNDARPVSVVDSTNSINYAQSATYAPPRGLASVVYGKSSSFNGITTSNSYNNRLFPTVLSASWSNGTALSLSYTYFANGNVNVETNGRDNGRSVTYTYDALKRVSTASSQATSDCWGQSFGYDRYANLTTINVTQCTAPMLSLSVNTNNQITNAGFTYDADGDLTGDGAYTYIWNAEQHLSYSDGVGYTYDGDLRRVEKSSSGTLYWYCATCGNLLAETDASGDIISEYALFNRQRIARRDISSGNVYYLFRDRLGSYRTLTDSSGNVKGESDYYPFAAERVISSTVTDNFRFAGMEWDPERGLNHTLYRQYTPAQCRWETPDPVQGCLSFPQGQNLYAYVGDSPMNAVDPQGDALLCSESTMGANCLAAQAIAQAGHAGTPSLCWGCFACCVRASVQAAVNCVEDCLSWFWPPGDEVGVLLLALCVGSCPAGFAIDLNYCVLNAVGCVTSGKGAVGACCLPTAYPPFYWLY